MFEPMDTSNLPDFREAIPDAQHIDDDGARALAAAILLRAAKDYYNVCDEPNREIVISNKGKDKNETPMAAIMSRHMIEKFIDSDWFGNLTSIEPEVFRSAIKKMKGSGEKFPGQNDLPEPQPVSEMAEMPINKREHHRRYGRYKKVC